MVRRQATWQNRHENEECGGQSAAFWEMLSCHNVAICIFQMWGRPHDSGFNKLLMRNKNYFFVECLLYNRSKLPPIQSAVSSLESRRASACFILQRLIWSRGCISSKDLGKYVLINAIPNDKLG